MFLCLCLLAKFIAFVLYYVVAFIGFTAYLKNILYYGVQGNFEYCLLFLNFVFIVYVDKAFFVEYAYATFILFYFRSLFAFFESHETTIDGDTYAVSLYIPDLKRMAADRAKALGRHLLDQLKLSMISICKGVRNRSIDLGYQIRDFLVSFRELTDATYDGGVTDLPEPIQAFILLPDLKEDGPLRDILKTEELEVPWYLKYKEHISNAYSGVWLDKSGFLSGMLNTTEDIGSGLALIFAYLWVQGRDTVDSDVTNWLGSATLFIEGVKNGTFTLY